MICLVCGVRTIDACCDEHPVVGENGDGVRLYHYTGREHVAPIGKMGITIGGVPSRLDASKPEHLHQPYIWLTTLKSWTQPWSPRPVRTPSHICDRTEARFLVSIPKSHRENLWTWSETILRLSLPADLVSVMMLETPGDSVNWRIFKGTIPVGWIRGMGFRP